MGLINKIKERIYGKNEMYSSEICSDCQLAEKYFKDRNIDILVKKIENDKYRQELKEKHGKVLVPTIIIKGKKFIGFEQNKDEIERTLRIRHMANL